ncbi:MAG TPA: ribosomal protein S18-alanine N-acetyltransferase [Fimbriimonadaceae bacterium]|nr:ribosomal protein S18-alanine N-acetyltransferase [Fimbriimonadaceae bacterium]
MKGASLAPLEDSHIDQILLIEKSANGSPWSRKSFEQEIGHEPSEFIVAKKDGRVIGYAGAWIVADECHITTVAVAEEFRRQGLGKRLIVELLERSRDRGALCATLEVRAGNAAAIALYDGLGFRSAGRRKAYYPNNREDAVIMWLNDLEGWKP